MILNSNDWNEACAANNENDCVDIDHLQRLLISVHCTWMTIDYRWWYTYNGEVYVCNIFAYLVFLPFLDTFGSRNKRKCV